MMHPSTPVRCAERRWLALVMLGACAGPVLAWTGTLPDGAQVQMDPDTRKATRLEGGTAVPLWDGVHRLDDGRVLIVRDGTVVPDASLPPPGEAQDAPDALAGACARLVERVCGADNACANAPACAPARRLLSQEAAERAESGLAPSAAQCREALGNAFFAACPDNDAASHSGSSTALPSR